MLVKCEKCDAVYDDFNHRKHCPHEQFRVSESALKHLRAAQAAPVGNPGYTFAQILDQISDGKAYVFSNPGLGCYFYKAPYPNDEEQTRLDGACSAITCWPKSASQSRAKQASPVFLLDDFTTRNDWKLVLVVKHPSTHDYSSIFTKGNRT